MLDFELYQAYHQTDYQFKLGQKIFILKPLTNNSKLDQWLTRRNYNKVTVISAANPFSEKLSAIENETRQMKLKQDLNGDYIVLPARGISWDNKWQEIAWAVLDLETEQAKKLAKKYKQYAWLEYDRGSIAKNKINTR